MRDGTATAINVDPNVVFAEALAEIAELQGRAASLDECAAVLPLKSTGAKAAVATALGYANFDGYVQAVLHHLTAKSATGVAMLDFLRAELPKPGG